jgi:hypothetical protein
MRLAASLNRREPQILSTVRPGYRRLAALIVFWTASRSASRRRLDRVAGAVGEELASGPKRSVKALGAAIFQRSRQAW